MSKLALPLILSLFLFVLLPFSQVVAGYVSFDFKGLNLGQEAVGAKPKMADGLLSFLGHQLSFTASRAQTEEQSETVLDFSFRQNQKLNPFVQVAMAEQKIGLTQEPSQYERDLSIKAGLRYTLSDGVDLDTGYRYVTSEDLGLPNALDNHAGHEFRLGLTFELE